MSLDNAYNALIVDLPPLPELNERNQNGITGLGHVLEPGEIDVSHGTILRQHRGA